MNKWKNQCLSNKLFDVINIVALCLIALCCLYPLYYVVIVSFSKQVYGTYLWPQNFSLQGYQGIFKDGGIWNGYANTIFYTGFGTLFALAVTLPGAYALSRKDLVGRKAFMYLILVTMYVSGGLVPSYLNMVNLGLNGTRAAIIINGACTAYYIILSRTFFSSTIPGELLEAAIMDGCGNGRFFCKIVLPLSKPIVAVMALYYGVARWNSYFPEMIYLRDRKQYPVSLFLRELLANARAVERMMLELTDPSLLGDYVAKAKQAEIMQYGLIVLSTLPMLIIFPFLQKYFAKGVMIGSVKG